jgi:hypothetical protein
LQGLALTDTDFLLPRESILELTTRRWKPDLCSLKRYFLRMAQRHAVLPLVVMASERSAAAFRARLRAESLVAR